MAGLGKPSEEPPEIPHPGVTGMEHTADVGLELEADTLPELFRRGALGAMWLVLERDPTAGNAADSRGAVGSAGVSRSLELAEEDLAALFRSWLRTLLFWEETEGFVTRDMALTFFPAPSCGSPGGQAFGLTARVEGVLDPGPRVREIKGVTFHGLEVERAGEGWKGRVVFDV